MSKFLLALIMSISGLTAAGAASSAEAPADHPRSCAFDRLPDHADSRLNSRGVARYLAWSQTPANKRVLDSTHRALATLFGSAEAQQGRGQLENGLIGLVLDHREQRFVVVLSRHLKVDEYQERIDRLVPETGERGAAPLVVQRGCASSRALDRAMDVLEKGRAIRGRFSAIVDPASSRVQLALPRGLSAVPRALDRALGGVSSVITVDDDAAPAARKGHRRGDRSPHWGAASIHQPNGIICTSWASVRKGRRGMSVTAGHCGSNGTRWLSGRNFYGETRGRRNFPEQDNVRLHGRRGHRFVPRIWMDRGRSRVVTGATNPRVGQLVCKSGQTTGVVCSIEVVSTSAVARYAGGTNRNLIFAERQGVLVGQGGDSGGPVFHAKPGEAGLRGMEVAGKTSSDLFAEKAVSIQRNLGVKVMRRR